MTANGKWKKLKRKWTKQKINWKTPKKTGTPITLLPTNRWEINNKDENNLNEQRDTHSSESPRVNEGLNKENPSKYKQKRAIDSTLTKT